ncbi:hypothetical protein [Clostridium tyrobutyricum]|uniref:hypothetical protein n=1 Tax=Clostridium tyrobutyricum TaxID=1519 RepID=UPI001C3DFBF6|nr:hypothetical protein [Clostridium tyrobutyricum]MBV4438437.1 hypothetical protein [Clostridium tyrobutyricum]
MKILLIDDLTVYTKKNEYTVHIADNKVLAENISELEVLKKENEYCFPLVSVEHEGQKYILKYSIEEGYKPITRAKIYSNVLRLSILERILAINPLEAFEDKVILHPQNIFFKDLKSIKFMYRSNKLIPYIHNYTDLEQYKLLVMSMISQYSLEKFKINKNSLLNKIKDNFLFKVDKAQSIEELHSIVNEKLNTDETQHFKDIETTKKLNTQKKTMTRILTGAVILIILIVVIGVSKVSNNKVKDVYSNKIEMADNKANAYKYLSLGEYQRGTNLLKKSGYTKSQISDVYLEFEQYDSAIKADPNSTSEVIKRMYETGNQKKILDLKTNNSYINTEKQIVSYNYNYLLAGKQLISDNDQLERLALAFIAHGNIVDAEDVNSKLHSEDITTAINEKNATNKINSLKGSMSKETDSKKKAAIKKQIDDLTQQYLQKDSKK